MDIPKLTDLQEEDVRGKKVIVRMDFNVPIKNGQIENDFRIRASLRTLSWLTSRGAKVILISHKGKDETTSLEVVHEYLSRSLDIGFVKDYRDGTAHHTLNQLAEGDVIMFENLRLHPEEKANDVGFAQELANYGDLYVNEAFPVSHREHASVVGIPKFLPAYAGLQFIDEVEHISLVFSPEHPFLFIIGGAKFSTKIPLIEKFLDRADNVFVSGALATVFFKEQGYETGQSLMPDEEYDVKHMLASEQLVLPNDVVCRTEDGGMEKKLESVKPDDDIRDIGPASMEKLATLIEDAQTILWNGPLGDYEAGFGETTHQLANAIAENGSTSVIGGGDTVAAISGMEIEDMFTFVSTAGGAMVQYLADETLPGLEALRS